MKFRICFAFCLLILLACSKKGNNTPAPVYVDAAGTWSEQEAKSKGGSSNFQYSATDHPCLSENKMEFKAGTEGRNYFAGTDSCYLYHDGSSLIVAGVPGDDYAFTWRQTKDTVILTYASGGKDTGIVSTTGGKNYLILTNHYSSGNVYTVTCTK